MPIRTEIVLAALGSALILAGCGGMQPVPQNGANQVWTTHDERPEWTRRAEPETDKGKPWFFVGESMRHATERAAIDAARRDAVATAVKSVRRNVDIIETERIGGDNTDREVQTQGVTTEKNRRISSGGNIGPIRVADSYVTAYDSDEDGRFYRAFVRVRVPTEAREAYRNSFHPSEAEDPAESATGGSIGGANGAAGEAGDQKG